MFSTPPFLALRAFEAVGRLGGIRRAALDLKLDYTVVSRHLRALEEWAGVPLINRQRDGRVLTDAGAQFHKRISARLAGDRAGQRRLAGDSGNQLLRIWCMPGLALHWLTARLPHFQALHPEVELLAASVRGAAPISRAMKRKWIFAISTAMRRSILPSSAAWRAGCGSRVRRSFRLRARLSRASLRPLEHGARPRESDADSRRGR